MRSTVHATGFSQWLMTDFWEGASLDAPKFSATQEHCFPKPFAIRYFPFAIRYSLPFSRLVPIIFA
ncbi:MAG: hypothetical protein DFNUSKGM_000509 [Candidatus Fervidibacter sacchari]|jgi:hypothetical protein